MVDYRVIPLICPDCGGELAGLRYDRVFFCSSCRQGLFPEPGSDWIRYPLSFPKLEETPRTETVHLPFWQIKFICNAFPTNSGQEIATRCLEGMDSAWITGFTVIRPSYFGDLGLVYTEKKVKPAPADRVSDGIFTAGCTRTIEDALKYVKLYVTLILDKRADVTGMDIQVETRDARLWAMPFADYGDKVMDLVTGLELPAFAVDDLEDIRKRSRKG